MKIAMIGSKGIPATWGGIERHVEEISARLVQLGHEVTVYCRPYYTETLDEYYRGVRLKRLPTVQSKNLDAITHTLASTLHAIPRGYDILHYHAIGPATLSILGRITGQKTVVTVHGLDWQREKWGTNAKLFLQYGEKASVIFPNHTIAVSKYLKTYLEDKYHKPVSYIPNAVLPPVVRLPNLIKEYGLGSRDYMLFVARLVPEKGCHFLIEAYERLKPGMKLVIAGGSSHSDEYVQELEKHASENIIFTGYVHGARLQELYSNAYCYVHPSTIEGLPFTLLEAVSYGNCVVASDIPPNAEVVEDTGILFKTQSVDALCDALEKVIADPALARELAVKAETHGLAEYNYDSVTQKTEEAYRSILGR